MPDLNKRSYAKRNKNKRLPFGLNIGTVIFGAILVYLIVFLVLYYTSNHTAYYRVMSGPLAKNELYTGFIVRDEKVITSDTSGYVHYYAQNLSKVKKLGPLYGTGTAATVSENNELSSGVKSDIKNTVKSFATNFDPLKYSSVNSLKYDISGKIVSDSDVLNDYEMTTLKENFTVGDITVSTAPVDGVVLYSVDGYENFDLNDFTSDIMDRNSYQETQLRTKEKVSAGDDICKIVDKEEWSILIPLSSNQVVKLNSIDKVKVKFLSDNTTETGDFTIITASDGSSFGKIDFTSGMIRYVNQRYVDIELVTNTKTGLKIPISAICTKEFYTVPEEYVTSKDDDDGDVGFMKEVRTSDGNVTSEFVSTTLYEHKDGKYYIDSSDFSAGDVILLKNTEGERFIVNPTASIEGVYCTNKGYAVFRKISIIDKNEEYCIVETGTRYGISQFDYIVLNASEVKEDQIMVK